MERTRDHSACSNSEIVPFSESSRSPIASTVGALDPVTITWENISGFDSANRNKASQRGRSTNLSMCHRPFERGMCSCLSVFVTNYIWKRLVWKMIASSHAAFAFVDRSRSVRFDIAITTPRATIVSKDNLSGQTCASEQEDRWVYANH